MDKQTYRTGLKTVGIIYLVLALLDLGTTVWSWVNGAYDAKALSSTYGVSESILSTLLYLMLGVTLVTVLVKIWLGLAGIQQANGKAMGKAHIVLGILVAVIATIDFVLQIGGVFAGTAAEADAGLAGANCSLAMMYVVYAKGVART